MSTEPPKTARHVSTDVVHVGNWVRLVTHTYEDEKSQIAKWEALERTTRAGAVDGVDIVAILKNPDRDDRILLVKQYRPPIKRYCIEFPAGLIDEGERPEESALRELKEETGYVGTVVSISPILAMEPGIANANCNVVYVTIDGDAEENLHPEQELEPTENIEVILLERNIVMQALQTYSQDCYIDAKLWTFCFAWTGGI